MNFTSENEWNNEAWKKVYHRSVDAVQYRFFSSVCLCSCITNDRVAWQRNQWQPIDQLNGLSFVVINVIPFCIRLTRYSYFMHCESETKLHTLFSTYRLYRMVWARELQKLRHIYIGVVDGAHKAHRTLSLRWGKRKWQNVWHFIFRRRNASQFL